MDFYLDATRTKEHAEVVRLAGAKDAASRESLRGYVREAQRTYVLLADSEFEAKY